MLDIRRIVYENPLLAILRNVPKEKIIGAAEALVMGGVRFLEVALNSPDAAYEIREIKKRFGDGVMVGAGTAINIPRAKAAIDAGADFLLAPSADREVLEYARDNRIAMLPGVLTPSDVSLALSYGFDTLKLFPAGDMPMGYVKSLKGPFDGTEYVAIGGVNKANIPEFIRHGYIGVGLGSAIFPKDAIESGNFAEACEAVAEMYRSVIEAKEKM